MVSHHHNEAESIKEATNKILQYWKEPKKYEFTSQINEIKKDWILLNDNYFYPEGGGQLSDKGLIKTSNNSYKVIDVQWLDDEIWLKVPKHNLNKNDEIIGIIDKKRRESLSRNHSAQHLVSAAFWEELEIETISADIKVDESMIELNKSFTFEDINKALNAVESYISLNEPITSEYFTEKDLGKHKIRGAIPKNHEIYRLVKIGNYDQNLCGGTHVNSTAEIDSIFLTKIEGKKIRFQSGLPARINSLKMNLNVYEISRELGINQNEVKTRIKDIYEERNQLIKDVRKYEYEITKNKINKTKTVKIGNLKCKFVEIDDLEKNLILNLIGIPNNNELNFILTNSRIFYLIAGDEAIVTSISSILKEKNIKNGGRGNVLQGKLNNDIQLEEIRNLFKNRLS